jgi:hypothetical protein
VGVDARLSVEGTQYEVDPELAGETVMLWWGLFDSELYVEHREKRYGPYHPVRGPIPLHRYRRFKQTQTQQRADRIEALAAALALPREALEDASLALPLSVKRPVPEVPFADPDPFQEFTYPSAIAAKLAIADEIAMPLAKLPPETMAEIDAFLARTLRKADVLAFARRHVRPSQKEDAHAE